MGWISGSVEDRRARGVTKVLVHVDGEDVELYELSSVDEERQAALL